MVSANLRKFLMDYLKAYTGKYLLSGGEVPAIRYGALPLGVRSVQGLELVFSKSPTLIRAGMNTIATESTVTLVDRNEDGSNLEQAILKLSTLDNFKSCVYLPATNLPTRNSNIPNQAIVTFTDSTVVRVVSTNSVD